MSASRLTLIAVGITWAINLSLSLASPAADPTASPIWRERILNRDGTMNWAQYEFVAAHAGELAQRDYLLGPRYEYFHPRAEVLPTLALQGDADGWEGAPQNKRYVQSQGGPTAEWYSQAGPLLYVADDQNNAGVVEAANGEGFWYPRSSPPWGYYDKVYWHAIFPRGREFHRYRFAVPPELAQPDWHSPTKPIAIAAQSGIAAPQAIYVAFENGLIGTMPVDPCEWTFINNGLGNNYSEENYERAYSLGPNKSIFPSVQLPPGKVPMALAVTPCGEFVLAAVWDTIDHKGQLAVIAVQSRVRCSEQRRNWSSMMSTGTWMYGIPGWPTTKGLKLLGYIDLPIAAPTAIKAGTNMGWQSNGRLEGTINANVSENLNTQRERDTWHNSNPAKYPNFKATAHAGYAVIASRSENKLVFVDLLPLLQYYRKMYFTTQQLYDQTKNVGPAPNQWPYTFDDAPEQTPAVSYTLDVNAPTALAAGLSIGNATGCPECNASWNPFHSWRVTPGFGDQYCYVTTLDGRLLMYNVGNLNSENAPTRPVLYKSIPIGKNPSSMEYGNGGNYKNDIVINCRGDNSIYALQASGVLSYVLRDSRINDAVMAEPSWGIGRGRVPIDGVRYFIHVVDFSGKKIHTYVYKQDFPEPMKFASSTDVPGHPFAYEQDEVP